MFSFTRLCSSVLHLVINDKWDAKANTSSDTWHGHNSLEFIGGNVQAELGESMFPETFILKAGCSARQG